MSYLCDRYDIYFHDIYLHAPNRLTSSWPKWMGLQMVTTRQENFPFQMRLFCKFIFFCYKFCICSLIFHVTGMVKDPVLFSFFLLHILFHHYITPIHLHIYNPAGSLYSSFSFFLSFIFTPRWMNLLGDIEDLESALDPSLSNMSIEDFVKSGRTLGDGHCSALVKVLPGNTDLYVSHVTWNT